jgi:hypothetical protein
MMFKASLFNGRTSIRFAQVDRCWRPSLAFGRPSSRRDVARVAGGRPTTRGHLARPLCSRSQCRPHASLGNLEKARSYLGSRARASELAVATSAPRTEARRTRAAAAVATQSVACVRAGFRRLQPRRIFWITSVRAPGLPVRQIGRPQCVVKYILTLPARW